MRPIARFTRHRWMRGVVDRWGFPTSVIGGTNVPLESLLAKGLPIEGEFAEYPSLTLSHPDLVADDIQSVVAPAVAQWKSAHQEDGQAVTGLTALTISECAQLCGRGVDLVLQAAASKLSCLSLSNLSSGALRPPSVAFVELTALHIGSIDAFTTPAENPVFGFAVPERAQCAAKSTSFLVNTGKITNGEVWLRTLAATSACAGSGWRLLEVEPCSGVSPDAVSAVVGWHLQTLEVIKIDFSVQLAAQRNADCDAGLFDSMDFALACRGLVETLHRSQRARVLALPAAAWAGLASIAPGHAFDDDMEKPSLEEVVGVAVAPTADANHCTLRSLLALAPNVNSLQFHSRSVMNASDLVMYLNAAAELSSVSIPVSSTEQGLALLDALSSQECRCPGYVTLWGLQEVTLPETARKHFLRAQPNVDLASASIHWAE